MNNYFQKLKSSLRLSDNDIVSITKANIGFIIALLFLWLVDPFQRVFATTSLGNYTYIFIVVICLNGGISLGMYIDNFVLLTACLIASSIFSLILGSLHQGSTAAIAILAFIGFFLFNFVRMLGPRFMGVSIFGCLLVAIATISTVNNNSLPSNLQNTANLPQPIFHYTFVAMLIGGLITLIPCLLIFPKTAHSEFQEFLSTWVSSLSDLLELSIRYYAEPTHDKETLAKMQGLVMQLQMKLAMVDMHLNNVASEPNYSFLTFKQIQPISTKLRSLTQQVLFMHASVLEYRSWLDSGNRQFPNPEKMSNLAEQVIANLKLVLHEIAQQLAGPKSRGSSAVSTPRIVKVDLEVDTKDAFGSVNDSSPSKMDSSSLHTKTIESIVQLEFLLRNSLDHLYKEAEQHKGESGWAKDTESILTIYHFSLALEEVSKQLLELSLSVQQETSGKHWYFPFSKWIPKRYVSSLLRAFTPKSYYSSEGRFSFAVWYAAVYNFFKRNIWPLKSAIVMSLFLVLFLDPTSKVFYNQYGLSGGLITLLIVVTPNVGGSFMAIFFELIGNITGNLLAMGFFYAMGPTPYLLWIPALIVGIPGFYLLIKMPQYTSGSLLLLLGFTGTMTACWNQQYVGNPNIPAARFLVSTPYWLISMRSIATLCIGLGFGAVFNMLIFPRFAKHDLTHKISKTIEGLEGVYLRLMALPANVSTSLFSLQGAPTDRNAIMEKAKLEMAGITDSINMLQASIFEMRMLLAQAEFEPEIEFKFVAAKYLAVIGKLQTIINSMRGATLALREPWYTSQSIVELWTPVEVEKKERLLSTMIVLFRLYEGSVLRRRLLPANRPVAMKVREELSYDVLSKHLSKSLQRSHPVHQIEQDEQTARDEEVTLAIEEGIEKAWERARSIMTVPDDVTFDRKYGVANLYDVYAFSHIAWMRQITKSTDELGSLLDDLI